VVLPSNSDTKLVLSVAAFGVLSLPGVDVLFEAGDWQLLRYAATANMESICFMI
jgi:hypothetical protein